MAFPHDRTGFCLRCKRKTIWLLKRSTSTSGSRHYAWVCSVCNVLNPNRSRFLWISVNKILEYLDSPSQLDLLPEIIRERETVYCVVCGWPEGETHHWAPRALFKDESEEWPTDYLCKACHERWHKIVTPYLSTP